MYTSALQTPVKQEEAEDKGEKQVEKNGFQYQSHFGPKTRETELRLGISSSGGTGTMDSKEQLKQRSNTICGGKRWFSETGDAAALQRRSWRPSPDKRVESTSAASRSSSMAVVGWPPVQAFRRNMGPPPKPETKIDTTSNAANTDNKPSNKLNKEERSMYVKVNLEGNPVGRKINLKAHDSYDSLSQALRKMFNSFFTMNLSRKQDENDNEGMDSDHVVLYEDNEGDKMLIGDVPWDMFVGTVKRLYIINGSKAPPLDAGQGSLMIMT